MGCTSSIDDTVVVEAKAIEGNFWSSDSNETIIVHFNGGTSMVLPLSYMRRMQHNFPNLIRSEEDGKIVVDIWFAELVRIAMLLHEEKTGRVCDKELFKALFMTGGLHHI